MEARTPDSPAEAEVAAVVALILAGQAPAEVAAAGGVEPAVALALLAFVPVGLPWALRARVSGEVAALVLRGSQGAPKGPGAILVAQRSNLVYRALYGINAVGRIVRALGRDGEGLEAALRAESRHLAAHQEANERRVAGARVVDAASALYGEVLGWNHGPNGPGDRPHHVRADGLNFRVDAPPRETDGYPGVLVNCRCFVGPPRKGARVMT